MARNITCDGCGKDMSRDAVQNVYLGAFAMEAPQNFGVVTTVSNPVGYLGPKFTPLFGSTISQALDLCRECAEASRKVAPEVLKELRKRNGGAA